MSKIKASLAVVVATLALGIWGWPFWERSLLNKSSLRDTAGIHVAILKVHPLENCCRVDWRITNRSNRMAEQVVLRITLMQSNGQVLGANPLVNAAALAPDETRELTVHFPGRVSSPNLRAQADIALVRWKQ